jgi:hypothetical protein
LPRRAAPPWFRGVAAACGLLLARGMLAGFETAVAFLIIVGTMMRMFVDDDAH